MCIYCCVLGCYFFVGWNVKLCYSLTHLRSNHVTTTVEIQSRLTVFDVNYGLYIVAAYSSSLLTSLYIATRVVGCYVGNTFYMPFLFSVQFSCPYTFCKFYYRELYQCEILLRWHVKNIVMNVVLRRGNNSTYAAL